MAALPSPTQVAGNHNAIYEAYYNKVDPTGSGVIQALDAARFLKKSNLSDVILSKVWDLSDPSGRGYLDKGGLFVALKLVALAQAGKEISIANISSETPPPKVGDMPKVPPNVPPPPASDWSVKPAERDKYNQLFDSLQPSNGLIPGNKVKGVLMESKLPMPTLGKIWDLADQDKDGMLDRHEFIVAMHLVYKALEKHAIPAVLPPELRAPLGGGSHGPPPPRPPSRPASRPQSPSPSRPPPPRPAAVPSAVPLAPIIPSLIPDIQSAPTANHIKPWVVTPAEKQQYDKLFVSADKDMDGFVSGMEIKDTFLQSGLPQQTLAHIWGLCDWDSSGKLSMDQFALAMWMVQRKLRGIEPPAALAPDMIPPSARTDQPQQQALPKELQPSLGPQPTPEMEALARDMEQLARERLALEAEVSSKEQSIRSKTTEANNLQSELDTLAATLKQLENQKGEAQKRLNDLQAQVEKLRTQAKAQESVVSAAESEAVARREAAAGLKRREEDLNNELTEHNKTVDNLTTQLQKSVLAISQATLKLTHLEEQEQRSNEAMESLSRALEGGPAPSHQHLQLQPPPTPHQLRLLVKGDEDSPQDDGFGNMNGPSKGGQDGFSSDPFKDDPFSSNSKGIANSSDPFAPASNNSNFASDPFTSNFGGSTPDPFGGDAFSSNQDNKNKTDDNKDPFGCDPFAILHAPTRDGPSPTPSLPPKKHKQPPPRPAPPRPAQPPSSAQFNADFSAFNSKLPSKSAASAISTNNGKPSALSQQVPKAKSPMDFTEDPFTNYRYEDPFNMKDPFADEARSSDEEWTQDSFGAFSTLPSTKSSVRTLNNNSNNNGSTSTAFDADDFFSSSSTTKEKNNNNSFGGRQSAPLATGDPFSKSGGRVSAPITTNTSNLSWATWDDSTTPNDNWATNDSWANSTTVSNNNNNNNNTSKITSKLSSQWSHTWSASKTKLEPPGKKEKKEKSPKTTRSFTQALHLGRNKSKLKSPSNNDSNTSSQPTAPQLNSQDVSWQEQLVWAEEESKRMEEERRKRQETEDRELKLAMELSMRNQ